MKDIELIPVNIKDIELIREWRNSLEVSQYMYTDDFITKEQQTSWFNKISQEENSRYWIVKYEDKKIGVASITNIDRINRKCFWGFYLENTEIRGKGIGAKIEFNVLKVVFDEMNLNKLCGEVFSFNEKVVNMHEKFGFRREGYLRNHIFKNNKFHDVVIIGLLSSEWNQLKESLRNKIYGESIIQKR
jgi:UDP-4-amino-4,6-dideoxy-N-acetyl-beta-L-altrosamine N-acetyltransferase